MKKNRNLKRQHAFFSVPKSWLIGIGSALFISGVIVYGISNQEVFDNVSNQLLVPHLEGQIEEEFDANVSIGTKNVSPKKVIIKNTGNTSLFVRVLVLAEIENKAGIQLPANIRKSDDDGKTTGQIELINYDKSIWLDGEDDYYYYSKRLNAEKSTEPLFTGIKINESVATPDSNPMNDNEIYYYSYQGSKLKITLKEETITSRGLTYQEAWNMKASDGSFLSPTIEKINQILEKEKE